MPKLFSAFRGIKLKKKHCAKLTSYPNLSKKLSSLPYMERQTSPIIMIGLRHHTMFVQKKTLYKRIYIGNVKGKGLHEDPEREQMYSSTLPSTSALDGGWVLNSTPRPLYPRERPGNHCTGGSVSYVRTVNASRIAFCDLADSQPRSKM